MSELLVVPQNSYFRRPKLDGSCRISKKSQLMSIQLEEILPTEENVEQATFNITSQKNVHDHDHV